MALFSSIEQLCFATFSHLKAFRFTQFAMDVRLRMAKELGQLQQEMNALQNLSECLPSDIKQLEEQLAEKKQQLRDAIKRQQRTLAYAGAVKQLSVAEVAPKQSRPTSTINWKSETQSYRALLQIL